MIDLHGKRIGSITVTSVAERRYGKHERRWNWICDCGKKGSTRAHALVHNKKTHCGCKKVMPVLDLAGQRFGMLSVTHLIGKNKSGERVWAWRCDCEQTGSASTGHLRAGRKTNCGCVAKGKRARRQDDVHEMVGKTFGKWTVIEIVDPKRDGFGSVACLCVCSCGFQQVKAPNTLSTAKACAKCVQSMKRSRKSSDPADYIIYRYKRGASNRGLVWALTDEEAIALLTAPCTYCGTALDRSYTQPNSILPSRTFRFTGIDRKDNSSGYTVSNCTPCCWPCNKMKQVMSSDEFVKRCISIAARAA